MTLRALWIFVVVLILASAGTAAAETRLFVPQFRYGPSEDTQFLAINGNDHDAVLDFWAFTGTGELLGQFQLQLRPHSTRTLTLGDALQIGERSASGWIGAVSPHDGIQLSYTWVGASPSAGTVRSFDAQPWTSREITLLVDDAAKDVVRISNPNPFPAQVTLRGTDPNGRLVGTRDFSVNAFAQIEGAISSWIGGDAVRLSLFSNADVLSAVDGSAFSQAGPWRNRGAAEEQFALVVESEQPVGAYQATLRFDPRSVQFEARDVEGGAADGFDSRPLVVNIDNAAGELTLASFQLGDQPRGRMVVARLNVRRLSGFAPRFGIQVHEIANTTGGSLLGGPVTVGLVRMK